ncbi:MAG TPA: hypothetical protein VN706_01065 [Gemmatimonadaceae bacterium]|nr:hypothetical protein [Gemmatimonadaceae bacterium]
MASSPASIFLAQEARAMLTRLARVKPFALIMPSVPSASVSVAAQSAIESYLAEGRRELRGRLLRFLQWIGGPAGRTASPADLQRRFTFLRLRFNVVLNHFNIFADVLAQRAEHETGVFCGGLDVLAGDALALPNVQLPEDPPIICYLERDPGAAIRRARTRLPGGGENPVAVIKIPRERMVSSGVASSLVHEVGHQGAALLKLNESLRVALQAKQRTASQLDQLTWSMWERWISEIVADLWSVSRVGIASTLGLMGVVSLPKAFVFRVNVDDPHPPPWIRVRLSCAMGAALYPHPQWERLSELWGSLYPLSESSDTQHGVFVMLERKKRELIELMLDHRPATLRGRSLRDVMQSTERQPVHLRRLYENWKGRPVAMRDNAPTLVFAAIGQARADGRLSPERESETLAYLLTYWALRGTLDVAEVCATDFGVRQGWRHAPIHVPRSAAIAAV